MACPFRVRFLRQHLVKELPVSTHELYGLLQGMIPSDQSKQHDQAGISINNGAETSANNHLLAPLAPCIAPVESRHTGNLNLYHLYSIPSYCRAYPHLSGVVRNIAFTILLLELLLQPLTCLAFSHPSG